MRRIRITWDVAICALSVALAGCSSSGGSDSNDASGGSSSSFGGSGGAFGATNGSGGSGVVDDSSLFSPEVALEYVGTIIEPGMEVTAMTLREDWLNDAVWLAAIQNTSASPLCTVTMDVSFLDAAGSELGAAHGLVEVPLMRGVSGAGGLVQCLAPGATGMVADNYASIAPESIASVVTMTYSFDAMILVDAAPTSDIVVTNVQVVDGGSDRYHFTGTLTNATGASVRNPAVSVFGTNAVGRPLAESSASELMTLLDGGSWDFETLGFYVPVVDYVAFPRATD